MQFAVEMSPPISSIIFILALALVDQSCASANQATEEPAQFFEEKVRPLLSDHCFKCHGAKKQHSDLRLDSLARLLQGGERGPAIEPFRPEDSRLIHAVRRGEKLAMPPEDEGDSLSPEEIAVLTKWISAGAAWPESEEDLAARDSEKAAKDYDNHWAFKEITDPTVPIIQGEYADWPRNDIDRFVINRLAENHLEPSPEASPSILYRRMKWDLLGLPPTLSEIAKFDPANSGGAIDQLLSNPHYGERWGRFWLDLARYADTKGYVFIVKPEFRNAWTYRDYVIDAFNNDIPYPQFVREQLAADLLHEAGEADRKALAALGFISVGARFKHEVDDIMADRIDVVSRGFLGLTIGCARCHDHKYDPITIEDYYSLYGVFRNSIEPVHAPFRTKPVDLTDDQQELAKQIQEAANELEQGYQNRYDEVMEDARVRLADYLSQAQSDRTGPDTTAFNVIVDSDDLNPQLVLSWRSFLESADKANDPIFLPWNRLAELSTKAFKERAPEVIASLEGTANPFVIDRLNQSPPGNFSEVIQLYCSLFESIQKLPTAKDSPRTAEVRAVLSHPDSPLNTPIHGFQLIRLFPDRPSQSAIKKLSAALDTLQDKAPVELAQMLTLADTSQPVEARVLNRGNASSPGAPVSRRYPSYFEKVRAQPFTKGSGRLELAEAIVSPDNTLTARVIVNRVWQHHFGLGLVASPSNFGMLAAPPSHPLLLDHLATWFVNHDWSIKSLHRYIMDSATWRQSSVARADGNDIDPANRLLWRMTRRRQDFESMRDALLAVSDRLDIRSVGGPSVKDATSETNQRRSIYTHINRQGLPGVMRTFDFPPPDVSSGERNQTTVPAQALFLMNHPQVLNAAKQLAVKAEAAAIPSEGIRHLYHTIFAREPEPRETSELLTFLEDDSNTTKRLDALNGTQSTGPSPWLIGSAKLNNPHKKDSADLNTFEPVTHWNEKGNRFQVSEKLPDPRRGWVMFDATGGHPGNGDYVAVIRWTAPSAMKVSITGSIGTTSSKGDGVRGQILVSGKPVAGPWIVFNQSATTSAINITVEQGETIDFVVDMLAGIGYDSFIWDPTITEQMQEPENSAARSWRYSAGFPSPTVSPDPVSSWQSLAQILLLSNEFQFID